MQSHHRNRNQEIRSNGLSNHTSPQAWQDANLSETLAGRIVLSIGCNTKSDVDLARAGVEIDKEMLDLLHLFKIEVADGILVLNVNRYIGESTKREVEYARRLGKRIRWLVEP